MKTSEQLTALVHELATLPREEEWFEFKRNKFDPQETGEYVSALSNAAALAGRESGFLIWGVDDETHDIVGTSVKPKQEKKGAEEFENWLLRLLEPKVDAKIHEFYIGNARIVILEVQAAVSRPVRFNGVEYIRIGNYKKRLLEYPEKERLLWLQFCRVPFEAGTAKSDASSEDVLTLIDYPEYFRLLKHPLPDNRTALLEALQQEGIITNIAGDHYNITNIGAILFARNLRQFSRLSRKALRVVVYRGTNKIEAIREQTGGKGYAIGFEGAIDFINNLLPQNEEIVRALRQELKMYPEIAIRELVANALIHQDFSLTGAGPMVEIYDGRIEITNPGAPLINTLRFIGGPPRSRNETLAALMRRMGFCEERGSGIVKVIDSVEMFQLPAPDFRASDGSTMAVLYGPRDFAHMDREERIRACYQHACLQYHSGKRMTNATLRKRLNIEDKNYPMASRVIKDTIDAEFIKPYSENTKEYVPFWA